MGSIALGEETRAKSMDDMQAVVTNSTVDGVLAALFAILVVVTVKRAGASTRASP